MSEPLMPEELALLRESTEPEYRRLPQPERGLVARLLDAAEAHEVIKHHYPPTEKAIRGFLGMGSKSQCAECGVPLVYEGGRWVEAEATSGGVTTEGLREAAQKLSDRLAYLHDVHIDREYPWESEWKALRAALSTTPPAPEP